MQQFLVILVLFLFLVSHSLEAQSVGPQDVFLVGNTGQLARRPDLQEVLRLALNEQTTNFALLFLGDLIDYSTGKKHVPADFEKELQMYANFREQYPQAKIEFIVGDRNWDNSSPLGATKVNQLKDWWSTIDLHRAFPKKPACPDPETVIINPYTVLIKINSQWFIHPHEKPIAPDTDCNRITPEDAWEELEELLEVHLDKNIILAAHHPVYSSGHYAGTGYGKNYLLPIYGNLKASFHQQIGSPRDLAFPAYANYAARMRKLLQNHSSIVYAAGHEADIQVIQKNGNFHLNVGTSGGERAATSSSPDHLFSSTDPGILKLTYPANGDVLLQVLQNNKVTFDQKIYQSACSETIGSALFNTGYIPCRESNHARLAPVSIPADSSMVIVAGPQYQATPFKQKIMGEQYRSEWTLPIRVPILELNNTSGGLHPYARGGGLQTNSLKFNGGDGYTYVFRSVDKNPERGLTDLAKQTIYKEVVKELITTQHPYGGLMVSKLMDTTDIIHTTAPLYVLPHDPALGEYLTDFGGTLGTFGLRITRSSSNRPELGSSDRIVSTFRMLKEFYEDNDHQIDAQAYARARMFDLWIGDWDRHEDNWKWARFSVDDKEIYRPIPVDRDHAFSLWEGLLPSLADQFIPNAESFEKDFKDIGDLVFKARHLDRRLAVTLTRADWQAAATYLAERMTDDYIDRSLLTMPEEVAAISGKEITDKLKSRREQLSQAADELYELLVREVDLIGSNKREIFQINRLPNGDVKVRISDRKNETGEAGKLLLDRVFHYHETQEIRLYGLGNMDEFYIDGTADKSILLRIIGGADVDVIEDHSVVRQFKKKSYVYVEDQERDQVIEGLDTKLKTPSKPVRYDYYNYESDAFSPSPGIRFSSGNGFGMDLLLTYQKRQFDSPLVDHEYQFKAVYYTLKAYRVDLGYRKYDFLGRWDLRMQGRFSGLYDKFTFFYGLGNKAIRDEELEEDNYYRMNFNTVQFSPTLQLDFWQQSNVAFGLRYEYNNVKPLKSQFNILNEPRNQDINGQGKQQLLGFVNTLDLDFRDHPVFSRRGSQLLLEQEHFYNFDSDNKSFGSLQGSLAQFFTMDFVTLALRLGGEVIYGDPPFYHYAVMGINNYNRTFVRNRFLGDRYAYFNSELRLHLGTLRTILAPVRVGVFGFYDVGQIWLNEVDDQTQLRHGVGGGIYAAPLREDFTFIYSVGYSKEDGVFTRLGFGFDF